MSAMPDHRDVPDSGASYSGSYAGHIRLALRAPLLSLQLCLLTAGCVAPPNQGELQTDVPKLLEPRENFQILPQTTSPNGQYALCFPHRNKLLDMADQGTERLALVHLSPFKPLCDIPLGHSPLILGHGYYGVTWMPDSSSFIMVQGLKWGPDRVYLGELSVHPTPRLTDLASLAAEIVRPGFEASGKPRFNDVFDFIISDEDRSGPTVGWTFLNSGDVAIDCTFTNNPKYDTLETWRLHWQTIWKRAERRFLQPAVYYPKKISATLESATPPQGKRNVSGENIMCLANS